MSMKYTEKEKWIIAQLMENRPPEQPLKEVLKIYNAGVREDRRRSESGFRSKIRLMKRMERMGSQGKSTGCQGRDSFDRTPCPQRKRRPSTSYSSHDISQDMLESPDTFDAPQWNNANVANSCFPSVALGSSPFVSTGAPGGSWVPQISYTADSPSVMRSGDADLRCFFAQEGELCTDMAAPQPANRTRPFENVGGEPDLQRTFFDLQDCRDPVWANQVREPTGPWNGLELYGMDKM